MKRLFFALWPDDQTRQNCVQVMKMLPASQHQPVDPANLHVTLVFLGGVDSLTEAALLHAAADIPVNEMSIRFDHLSFWKKPEVLCLTGGSLDGTLPLLVEALTNRVQPLAITPDERPYQAHVTLARKAKQAVAVAFEPIIWRSDSFCLVESCSSPEGIRYQVLRTWPAL
jgi:RNA 2',3'-cyclic 3'-phosphodiesterase